MDVEKLIRKLEPLIPERAGHWRRTLDLADPEVKGLLEKQIVRTAYELLGDFGKKPLPSLPPLSKSKGSIHLGTVMYEKEKWDFGLSQAELVRNMGIFGMSGSGKTNTGFYILKQLVEKGVPVLFWDWKRTARHLIPMLRKAVKVYTPGRKISPFRFNPFIVPDGLESAVYVGQLVDVIAEAYTLGDGSRSVLQKAISLCYQLGNRAPRVIDILAMLEKMPATGRVGGWKVSARRALESLVFSDMLTNDISAQEGLTEALFSGISVVELDALSQGAKKFLIPMMCLWLYYHRLASPAREQLELVIFVEEAHHVLYRQEQRAKETVMNMLMRQCRELGIGIVVIDQHPHLIASAALGNTYTTLCLNQRDPSDMNKAAGLSLVAEAEKKWFSMLPVGQAIVKLQGRWLAPFLLQVPLVQVRKGMVTDDLLSRFVNGSLTARALKAAVDRRFGRAKHAMTDEPLSDGALRFLEDVVAHQDESLRERYRRLGISVDKGTSLKNELVEKGVLEEEELKVGRARKVLLRITPAARARFGSAEGSGRGSIAHEYWKRFYASRLRDEGYDVELEGVRPGAPGRVDVLARRGSERVAVEIETGKSDVVSNVRHDLLAGFQRVVVVATDERVLASVERRLARTGLIVPRRVDLVMRGELSAIH